MKTPKDKYLNNPEYNHLINMLESLISQAQFTPSELRFEKDLEKLFGEKIKSDDEFAKRIYAALTNTLWRNEAIEYGASFRYTGGLIADIRGDGNYMDWYCCADAGNVDDDIAAALLTKGWTPHDYDLQI